MATVQMPDGQLVELPDDAGDDLKEKIRQKVASLRSQSAAPAASPEVAPPQIQSGYVGRGEFAPEAGAVSAPIGPESQDPTAQVAKGFFGAVGSMVPRSLGDAMSMLTLPRPGDVERQNQESEALGEAWRGEHGLEEQAKAITGTVLQAAPLIHLPFAESPLRATPKDLSLVKAFRTLTEQPESPTPLSDAATKEAEHASEITSTEGIHLRQQGSEVVGETSLRQQGEIAPTRQEIPTEPAAQGGVEGQQVAEAPLPQGFVRLYHGGGEASPQAGRDFTTSRQYAEDYAAKAEVDGQGKAKVWSVDVPEGSLKTHDETGQPMTRVVVPDEIANQAKPITPSPPRLLPGETQGDLLSSTQPEDLALVGEKGVDYEAIQKAKEKAAADRAESDKGQTTFEDLGEQLTKEEEDRIKDEYEKGLLSDLEDYQQQGGRELLDAVKSLGGLHLDEPHFNDLKEAFQKKAGFSKLATGEEGYRYKDIFKKNAPGADALVQALRQEGFDIETPGDLTDVLDRRFKTGKKVYGVEARAQEGGISGLGEVWGFGPGAAAEGEYATMGRKPIRMTNAAIDAERAARGAEPLMRAERKANPVLWDETMAQLDRTPQAAKILVDNINSGEVKTTNNVQQTMLLHEEISLRNEKAMAAERAVDPNATEEERTEARANFSALEARIDATERANNKFGSISGSALQARKVAAYDDFTHAAIETKFRNAKGAPLTFEESQKIAAQAAEIAKLKADLATAQEKGFRDQANEALANLIRENIKTAKTEARSGKTVIDILHDQRDAAKARIIARRGRLNTGIDPTSLLDEAIIGASHIADGFVKFAEWSQAMVKDFGERIKPYLEDLFQRSQEYHDAHAKLSKETKPKLTPVEKVAEAAKDTSAEGGLTNKMVFDLAREHVRAGVTGLDDVMSAVQKDLEPHFPGLTEREVRDMFSDYGKVRFPSKAADLAALRDYRRQGQLVSALEDAQEGLSPKRTGQQRDQPSERVLELQKKVQDAMRESGITTASDPTRLKTNLDRYKSSLDKRMADAERRLKEGDYAKPTRQATILDPEAIDKRALLDRKTQQINAEIEKQRLANRTGFEKFQDGAVKWARVAKLSSLRVFPKLIEAGLIRIVTNPVSRVLSQPLRLIPGMTEKAPAQLRMSMRAEAGRVASILSSGPEAFRKLVGKSKLDALSKKKLLDNEMANFVGNAHGAVKEPVRQGEYAAATKYYTEQALANGLDIREPAVQTAIDSSAVADANWQIFMGDNPFSKYFVSLVVNGLKNGKFTGARTLANAVQFVMPIVKVSSNIAIHTSRLGVGLPESMIRIGTALKRGELADGAAKLSHEDAQAITRSFSAGALGVILASYAWNNPDAFGGVHDDSAPKNKTGLKPNEIKTPLGVLPGWVNHAPEMQWLNTVASARRVYDKYYSKGSGTANSMTEALAFSLMSPVKNLPMIDTWLRYFSSHQSAGQTFGSTIRDAIIPGGQSTLGLFDKAERHPQNFWQEIEMGIPGLRQTVPQRIAGQSGGVKVRP